VIPEDLRYTDAHEWVRVSSEALPAGVVRVGITDYAQLQLGDVVFVQLPEVGSHLEAGTAVGEVESTKSVSELFAPVSGEVVARNEALDTEPELVNADPYGEGWLFDVRTEGPVVEGQEGLLDAGRYRSLTEQP
jgi:glycine cleavage system H protein